VFGTEQRNLPPADLERLAGEIRAQLGA